jgi:hypothetical protein
LTADYSEQCPNAASFIGVYSAIFSFCFPLGIPLFFYFTLAFMGVGKVSNYKVENSVLRAMMLAFVKEATSVEMQTLGRLVGLSQSQTQGNSHELDDSDGFRRRCNNLYKLYFTEDGLLNQDQNSSADWSTFKNLVDRHDVNGDGKIDEAEFQSMMSAVLKKTTLFTGAERGHELNEEQLRTLILYPFAKIEEPGKGAAFKNVIEKEEAKKKATAKRKKAELEEDERRHALESKLDELTTGLGEREKVSILRNIAILDGRKLCTNGTILMEDPRWDLDLKLEKPANSSDIDSEVSMKYLEMVAIERVGFIFLTYKVSFWWWELLEMIRK